MLRTLNYLKHCILLSIVVFTAGCFPIYRDVSRMPEYNQYVGTVAHLNTKKSLSLYKKQSPLANNHYSHYSLTGSDWDWSNGINPDEHFVSREPLEKGTKIEILAVKRGNDQDHVLMEVYSLSEDRKIMIQNTLGLSRMLPYDLESELRFLTFPDNQNADPVGGDQ